MLFCSYSAITGALIHNILELAVVQIGVEAAGIDQLVVGALLHNVAVPHHKDEVGILDGGQGDGVGCSAVIVSGWL